MLIMMTRLDNVESFARSLAYGETIVFVLRATEGALLNGLPLTTAVVIVIIILIIPANNYFLSQQSALRHHMKRPHG